MTLDITGNRCALFAPPSRESVNVPVALADRRCFLPENNALVRTLTALTSVTTRPNMQA